MKHKIKIISFVSSLVFGLILVHTIAFADDASTTPDTSTTTPSVTHITVNVSVRDGSNVVFSGPVELTQGQTETISDTLGATGNIGTDSALEALRTADAGSDAFAIDNLSYFPSFDSFLVNCIQINGATSTDACYSWQYVVNNSYPFVGADDYTLHDGDTVYFYFGSPRRFSIATTTAYVNDPVDVDAESYDYQNDIWTPLSGTTVGATQPDPSNPWSPLVPYSGTTDATGHANLVIGAPGNYDVGLATDFYFPTKPLTILATTTSATTTPVDTNTGNTDTSGGHHIEDSGTAKTFDVGSALSFLSSKQDASGAVGADLYTDWSAIAFAAGSAGNEQSKLAPYISSHGTTGNWLPDYERHAMALMALGINPRTGTSLDYISKIISTFDGTQFGDAGIFNDDIFALFPLIDAGYSANDTEVRKAVEFIISKQSANGAWNGVDVTAAGIQALSLVKNLPHVSDALSKARTYLVNSQSSDGGWNDSFATTWVIQAITALGESPSAWVKNGKSPLDYLANLQDSDGGITAGDNNSRIWATAYAIPASLNRTWDSILTHFSKPSTGTAGNQTVGGGSTSGTVIATTIASSTPKVLGAFIGPSDMSIDEMVQAILAYLFEVAHLSANTIIQF